MEAETENKFRLKCKYKCFNKYRADTRENTTAKSKYKYNWKYVPLFDLILPRCPSTKANLRAKFVQS